jgi:signal transduction histidine kinase
MRLPDFLTIWRRVRLPQIHTSSLSWRMIVVASATLLLLLTAGGYTLDTTLTRTLTDNSDEQMTLVLNAMLSSTQVNDAGEVEFERPLGDQRFLESESGHYWQISAPGHKTLRSRSLLGRSLHVDAHHHDMNSHYYDSEELAPEHLRIVERDVKLPFSATIWRFQVAQHDDELSDAIAQMHRLLLGSYAVVGLGLLLLFLGQIFYGLKPLRDLRKELAALRSGATHRIGLAHLPSEIAPLAEEINGLLDHSDAQAEDARRHAGNLAHALKTPLTVVINAATGNAPELADIVAREVQVMRRHIDHHLARAVGRRGGRGSRALVWKEVEAVSRAVSRLYPSTRIDYSGDKTLNARIDKQDLDELLGNLVENAAKYGNGTVFITVAALHDMVDITIEDDGPGIAEEDRKLLFDRGVRLDSRKPGTGLGLAIVRDVAQNYGGSVLLETSEELGGLMVHLKLPLAE